MWKEVKITDLEIGDEVKVTGQHVLNTFTEAEGIVVDAANYIVIIEFEGTGVKFKTLQQGGQRDEYNNCSCFYIYKTSCTFWREEPVYHTAK